MKIRVGMLLRDTARLISQGYCFDEEAVCE
jgi:hypothetical protein